MKKILIIEDDEDFRNNMAAQLERGSFGVLQAGDGEQGVTMIIDHQPDAILLDIMLPKLDGYHVLERLRAYPDKAIAGTHVIILSNLWSDKDILQAKALKVDEYFVKANTKTEDVLSRLNQLFLEAPKS